MAKKITIVCITFISILVLILTNALYINPSQITIREETIESVKIDDDLDGLIIVYFSDLYYGNYLDDEYLTRLVDKINLFDPDVVLFGGDLIADTYVLDGINKNKLIDTLSSINYHLSKFAVLGEQDLCSQNNIQEVTSILQDSNFVILNNDSKKVLIDSNSYINIVGVASMYKGEPNYETAFSKVDGAYTIALTHCPDSFADLLDYNFDYCLAGHSLAGQVYMPIINLLSRDYGCQKYLRGKHQANNQNKVLDITSGIGFKDGHIRLFSDSEIVVYKLKHKSSAIDTVATNEDNK